MSEKYQHVATGITYELITEAILAGTKAPVVVLRCHHAGIPVTVINKKVFHKYFQRIGSDPFDNGPWNRCV